MLIVHKDLQTQPRQSGKTSGLKLKAIELHQNHNKVVFVSFNQRASEENKRHFEAMEMGIECHSLQTLNANFLEPNKDIPAEYVLIYSGGVHIIFDEYTLMDDIKFNALLRQLEQIKHKFNIYGRGTIV